jgi:hypothetical protein
MDISHELEALQVDDELFAEAYAVLDAGRRSVLKKWIAQFYLFWGRDRGCEHSERVRWDQGFTTTTFTRPLDWSLVLLAEDFASPSQLVSVLMPMMFSGTRHVCVARETSGAISFPAPLLAAMELAGQEVVLTGQGDRLATMLEHLPETFGPLGKVCCLGRSAAASGLQAGMPEIDFWSAGSAQCAGIWIDQDVAWDFETIAWTLAGTKLYAGGSIPGNLSDHFTPLEEPFESFVGRDFGAFFLPHTRHLSPLPAVSTFGPGQEGGWLWPGITPQTFTRSTVVWHEEAFDHEETINGLT